jgi:hypothetical protein
MESFVLVENLFGILHAIWYFNHPQGIASSYLCSGTLAHGVFLPKTNGYFAKLKCIGGWGFVLPFFPHHFKSSKKLLNFQKQITGPQRLLEVIIFVCST